MPKVQFRLTLAVLFTALALLAFFGTNLISGPIDGLYRNAAGLNSARNVAQIAALAAVVVLFVADLIITISAALQPARWVLKLIYVIPVYFLGLALVSVISGLLGVGALGNFLDIQGVSSISFAAAFVAVGAGLGALGLVIATARARLSVRTLRVTSVLTALASIITEVATVAMVASVVIVATNQPSRFGFGGDRGQQFPPDRQNVSANQPPLQAPAGFQVVRQDGAAVQAPQSTPEVAPVGAQATPAPQSTPTSAGGNFGGAPGGDFGGGREGRPPGGDFGGPGGGFANLPTHYEIGGGLMAVFDGLALLATISLLFGLRGLSASTAPSVARLSLPREVGAALLSGVVLTLVFGGLIQLVQVPHANPPMQTTIKWDSAQTQDLATRACLDCHSNETRWPWYTYIAPISWVTALHVTQGRQRYNFSELNNLEGFRRQRMGEELAQQIRSGTMPPADYLLLHPDARLTDTEKQQLIDGLQKSLLGS